MYPWLFYRKDIWHSCTYKWPLVHRDTHSPTKLYLHVLRNPNTETPVIRYTHIFFSHTRTLHTQMHPDTRSHATITRHKAVAKLASARAFKSKHQKKKRNKRRGAKGEGPITHAHRHRYLYAWVPIHAIVQPHTMQIYIYIYNYTLRIQTLMHKQTSETTQPVSNVYTT